MNNRLLKKKGFQVPFPQNVEMKKLKPEKRNRVYTERN